MKKALSLILALALAGAMASSLAATLIPDPSFEAEVAKIEADRAYQRSKVTTIADRSVEGAYGTYVYQSDYIPSNPYNNISLTDDRNHKALTRDSSSDVTVTGYDESVRFLTYVNRFKELDRDNQALLISQAKYGTDYFVEGKKRDLEVVEGTKTLWESSYWGNSEYKVVARDTNYGYIYR